MIWTAVMFDPSTEKIDCDVFEASMDGEKAYISISGTSRKIVLSIVKGNHKGGCFVPDLSVSITRIKNDSDFKL
jgi:hypothetical protein